MAETLTIEELLVRNKSIAEDHVAPHTFAEMKTAGLSPPKTLIVTCVDPRADPNYFLGLKAGEAVMIRNIGGRVDPVLNDILALDVVLDLNQIIIVHHTDCGAVHFTNNQVRKVLRERAPSARHLDATNFGAISNLEQSIRDDLQLLHECGLVREGLKGRIKGFLYNIKSGKLEMVEK